MKNMTQSQPRIFVQIASYRDDECQWTVKDLFEKAAHPDRVFVGICWQFDEQEDQHCFQVSTRPEQVRIYPVDWREAEGVCWARYHAQQLWEGEEYTLQIDSHMRFVPGWDDLLIEELAACPSEKPLLTNSIGSYTPPNDLEKNPTPLVRRVTPFSKEGNIRGKSERIDRVPPVPLNAAFISAGFMFSRSDVIRDVPYDPYLYFDQEEITYALRLYTHGWDIFSARRPFLYHFYNVGPKAPSRPMHWRDLHKEDEKRIAFLRERGLARFNHITRHKISADPEVIRELDQYGLGTVRTLADYEAYTGIDFAGKRVSNRALCCEFIKDITKYRDRPIGPTEEEKKLLQPQAAPKAVAAASAAPAKSMLEPGDFMPMFEGVLSSQKKVNLHAYAGKFTLLYYLPSADETFIAAFFKHMAARFAQEKRPDAWTVFIVDDTPEKLDALQARHKIPYLLWADPKREVALSMGLCRPGAAAVTPAGYVLSRSLKIIDRQLGGAGEALFDATLAVCSREMEQDKKRNATPRIYRETVPTIIVPNVLSPEFCRRCVEAFKTGDTYEGTVGAAETKAYAPNTKVRTDYVPRGELLADLDEKFSKSLFPEIEKVFGFSVMHREIYKFGLYTGDKKGFFKQHRDNFEAPLGYRRIAVTINIGDDFEGGGVKFPEYNDDVYSPPLGAAIAFSCGTLHEALPVTGGERYIIVAFLHGVQDEAFRRHFQASVGEPDKAKDYQPKALYEPQADVSRDFYKKWLRQNVSYENPAPGLAKKQG